MLRYSSFPLTRDEHKCSCCCLFTFLMKISPWGRILSSFHVKREHSTWWVKYVFVMVTVHCDEGIMARTTLIRESILLLAHLQFRCLGHYGRECGGVPSGIRAVSETFTSLSTGRERGWAWPGLVKSQSSSCPVTHFLQQDLSKMYLSVVIKQAFKCLSLWGRFY